jgi:hypothetical protein
LAIRDLLWSCPSCRTTGGLRPKGKGREICAACGARFRRRHGAFIEQAAPGHAPPTVRHAGDWLADLPDVPESFAPPGAGPLATTRVAYRLAAGSRAIRKGRTFLGVIERFGQPHRGSLELYHDRVRVAPAREGEVLEFPLDSLTALQASSSTLQIKPRRAPPVSFRFPESSARYWEEALRAALRARYRQLGLGEIIEFQPRIAVR